VNCNANRDIIKKCETFFSLSSSYSFGLAHKRHDDDNQTINVSSRKVDLHETKVILLIAIIRWLQKAEETN
jgi:hypothetical protein